MRKLTGIWFAVAVFLAVSWVGNCIRFANCNFKPTYKAEVIYGVGIVTGIPFCWWNFDK